MLPHASIVVAQVELHALFAKAPMYLLFISMGRLPVPLDAHQVTTIIVMYVQNVQLIVIYALL